MDRFGVVLKPWDKARAEISLQVRQLNYYKKIAKQGTYVPTLAIATAFDDWGRACNRLRDELNMPRGKKESTPWKGFINIRFTAEQKEEFDNWEVNDEEVWHRLMQVIENDHKFTITYNKQNGTVNAAFTGGAGSGNNSGWTMSAFAKSWDVAVRAVVFKHYEIAGGDWQSVGSLDGDEYG